MFGIWYSGKLFKKNGWTAAEDLGRVHRAAATRSRRAGITPFAYAGANAAYYQYLVILTSAAKIGGAGRPEEHRQPRGRRLEGRAGQAGRHGVGRDRRQVHEQGNLGQKHTEVQLQQNQNKVGFYPSGSWLENEQKKDTPADFDYPVMPVPSVTASDKLPAAAICAAAGEGYFVSAKGKNPRGGMEYMRQMLSKAGAQGLHRADQGARPWSRARPTADHPARVRPARRPLTKAAGDERLQHSAATAGTRSSTTSAAPPPTS